MTRKAIHIILNREDFKEHRIFNRLLRWFGAKGNIKKVQAASIVVMVESIVMTDKPGKKEEL